MKRKKNDLIRNNLSKAFTTPSEGKEYKYKQSIAISELFLDGKSTLPQQAGCPRLNKAAGIVYPSVRIPAADNVVLLPEIVESSLRIKSVWYVKIEAANEVLSSYTYLSIGGNANTFSVDKKIEWQDNNMNEYDRRYHITHENGQWVLRDGYNRIYDVH